MRIVTADATHAGGIAALEQACFSHPWSLESITASLGDPQSVFYAALENGAVIGYIGMQFVLDEGYVLNVAVAGAHRRKGVGSALLQTLVTRCKKENFAFLTLEVRESNRAARSLYGQFGFIKVGERKNYYTQPDENAVLMTLFFLTSRRRTADGRRRGRVCSGICRSKKVNCGCASGRHTALFTADCAGSWEKIIPF